MDVDLRVISLGAGVQSSVLYAMAAEEQLGPLPNYAIFADTQQEPPWVYENLERLRARYGQRIPIRVATAGNLGEAVRLGVNSTGGRFAAVPFWMRSQGRDTPGRRQCTREYKIDVVKRTIRELLGLRPRQRAAGRFQVEEWLGISTDEAHRVKPSRYDWIRTRWPLIEQRMSRHSCLVWWREHIPEWSEPRKSACVFCPYRTAAEYARWREEHPQLFEEACRWDELIRSTGTRMNNQQYVTRRLHPLRELPPLEDLLGTDDAQLDLFGNECEGMCGV